MAHGAPDDSDVVKHVDLHRVDDMAELAARLGSIVSFVRSGSVMYMETFEGGLGAWDQNTTGTNAEVALCNDRVFSGNVAVYLKSGTGATPYANIAKLFPSPVASRVGLASYFSVVSGGKSFEIYLTTGDGVTTWYYRIRYDHSTGKLAYWTPTNTWTDFATHGVLYESANNYHTFKLVADFVTHKYVRFYLDGKEYSLADKVPEQATVNVGPYVFVILRARGDGSTHTELYLDNVVLTYDEL